MGDVTDLEAYRSQIRESVKLERNNVDDVSPLVKCPKCGDLMYYLAEIEGVTIVDEGGPYALICQHCDEPWGSANLFEDEDEDIEE